MSLDDPDFWQKVLNDSSSRRLLARLNDGSATASDEAMAEFMVDLQEAVEGIAVGMYVLLFHWFDSFFRVTFVMLNLYTG